MWLLIQRRLLAQCLAVTHGSTVEAEMFQQFVAVVGIPIFLDLLRIDETVARADIATAFSSESLSC
jgi:hypothetical protein